MPDVTIYRETAYYCGEEYLDVYIYPVYKRPGQRAKKAKPTTETQAKLNERHAAEKLGRLLNTNFTPNDLSFGCSYRVNPESDDQVKRDAHNYLDRLRRRYKKAGVPLKYIMVIEKSKAGRYHLHVIINDAGIDRDELERIWGYGYANSKRLEFGKTGLVGLAKYITKRPIFGKRWNASKNLIHPQPKPNDRRIRSRRKAAALAKDPEDRQPWEKLYPDYIMAEVVPFHNDENGGVYLFARLYRKDGVYSTASDRSRARPNAHHLDKT
ncbi:MAG: hypothetical protein FWE08_06095 [Oscillospiraceae bacterium]|nr:hypothetical protein [Oscillospiraceae bacterium]